MADPDQERLERLGDKIDEARHDAEEDGLLPDSTPEPTFKDPDAEGDAGDGPTDDAIAPG